MIDLPTEATIQMPLWGWIVFNLFVLTAVAIDLFALRRNKKGLPVKRALIACGAWVAFALLFNAMLYHFYGKEAALDFLAGYLIEESLSLDNLFVFILIFEYFKVPAKYQHKVLFWGILGAVVMRALFIFFGIALVSRFHWILYLFGAFLVYAAIKMAMPKSEEIHPENNSIITLLKKFIPLSSEYDKDKFFTLKNGKWWATPLFTALVTVELTDLMFAFDSIPAVMAITLDPFIVYTSNIFAILGLRSLYFALAHLMPLFHFLKYGLAGILAFVGFKMLLASWIEVPIVFSLGFIAASIILCTVLSFLFPKNEKKIN